MRLTEWLRKYSGGILLLLLLVGTTTAYWHQSYAASRAESQEHGQEWKVEDQRTRFWDGVWENDRSEYEQLFIQFLIMVAFANYLSKKQQEDLEKIQAKLDEMDKKLLPTTRRK